MNSPYNNNIYSYYTSQIEPEKSKYLPINCSPAWWFLILYWVIAFTAGILIPYIIGYVFLNPCRLPGQYS